MSSGTSYFCNSRDFQLGSATIINAENYSYNAGPSRTDRAFDCLREHIAAEALYNSEERCDAPTCHPETRKAVQEDIHGWINSEDEPKIMWLSGPAGGGKTAIAGSIAETCDEQGLLAGSFFFSSFAGSLNRRLKRGLIATLAYCLLQHDSLEMLRDPMLLAIERDPTIFRKRLRDQCRLLLLKPFYDALSRGPYDRTALPKVIIIDGLDEVEAVNSRQLEKHEARLANEADQVEILHALLQAAHDDNVPFRILIISRPERVIRKFFSTEANRVTREIFLDNKYDPDSDILLFLKAKFSDIRRRYNISPSWPTEAEFKQLVETASGQFIYAATVARFLEGGKLPNPRLLLTELLVWRSQDPGTNGLASLEALYTHIIMSSPDPRLATEWLEAFGDVLKETPALFSNQLLQEYEGQAEYVLENLQSLVHIPTSELNCKPYRLYHKSLLDYLESTGATRRSVDVRDVFIVRRAYSEYLQVEKSPAVPLTDAERGRFFRDLFTFDRSSGLWYLAHPNSAHDDLAKCDVDWVVRTLAVLGKPDDLRFIVGHFFDDIHRWKCLSLRGCGSICQRWRNTILSVCVSLGWRVPNAIALLREDMAYAPGICDDSDVIPISVSRCFEPPHDLKPPKRCTHPLAGEDRSGEVPIADYEALRKLVEAMYSCLPKHWERRYRAQSCETLRHRGRSEWNALQSEIAVIKGELGIDIPDFNPDYRDFEEGLYKPDENDRNESSESEDEDEDSDIETSDSDFEWGAVQDSEDEGAVGNARNDQDSSALGDQKQCPRTVHSNTVQYVNGTEGARMVEAECCFNALVEGQSSTHAGPMPAISTGPYMAHDVGFTPNYNATWSETHVPDPPLHNSSLLEPQGLDTDLQHSNSLFTPGSATLDLIPDFVFNWEPVRVRCAARPSSDHGGRCSAMDHTGFDLHHHHHLSHETQYEATQQGSAGSDLPGGVDCSLDESFDDWLRKISSPPSDM
ncbi:hypothetical protein NMY22_g4716 [Coprinellus aureogranulatus]|nr:hypothetical protein NMY22_g4716 [Coprinellus aureogranulatus]